MASSDPGPAPAPSLSPAERRPLDRGVAGAMLLLCAIWGAQQVAIKLAAPDVVPMMQVALRSGLSALLLAAFAVVRGEPISLGGPTARPGAVAGALFAVEFLFIAEGLRHTSASHMAVFLYTAPVFTALGLHLFLPAERLRRRQWLGVGVAFGGIALAFLGGGLAGGGGGLAFWGDLCGVLAGAAWGATTVVIRTTALSEAPANRTLLYQLLGAFVLLLPVALAASRTAGVSLTAVSVASLLFQGVVVSFASYLAWFHLLRRYLASRLSVFSFLTPIFGVAFGVLVLSDPITPSFGAGAALVLAGIALVSGWDLLRKAPAGSRAGAE
ncbi:MAG TPA: DMT family transporter [Anaeromyxobacteraceae bacterium]|nr:DMT family transporter [Anaeromyxobacteraceae bacterium]